MQHSERMKKTGEKAFTLIEMLLVVAIIGIMSSLIIAAISNSAEDARLIIARQQQSVLQEALNAWISAYSQTNLGGVSAAKTAYGSASTAVAKLGLLQSYLDSGTYDHLVEYSTNSAQIQSEALSKIGHSLVFSTWGTNSYPRVNMQ